MSKHLSQFQLRLVVLMFSKYFIVEKRNVKGEVGVFFCEQKRCQWTYLKSFCLHSQFLVVSHFFYLDSRCLLECVKSTKNVVCWVRLKKEGNLIKKRQKLEFEPRTILIFDVSRSRVKWRFVFEIWHNFEIDMTATRVWKKSKNAKKERNEIIYLFFIFSSLVRVCCPKLVPLIFRSPTKSAIKLFNFQMFFQTLKKSSVRHGKNLVRLKEIKFSTLWLIFVPSRLNIFAGWRFCDFCGILWDPFSFSFFMRVDAGSQPRAHEREKYDLFKFEFFALFTHS